MLEERSEVTAGAERRDAEVLEDVVLVLLYPKVGDLDIGLSEERTLVLACIPQRLGGVSRVRDAESSTLNQVCKRR